jgi:hypothetical protein
VKHAPDHTRKDKTHFRGQLQTVKNNFALAQLGVALMGDEDALGRFEKTLEMVSGHPESQSLAYIRYVFQSDAFLKHATKEFRNSVLRNCLKETFELVKAYGKRTEQTALFRKAPWYAFLRIVRNCLSHDMLLCFTEYDLKQLPVSWSGLTIERSMNNKPLPMRGFLSRPKAVELMDDVIKYVELHAV